MGVLVSSAGHVIIHIFSTRFNDSEVKVSQQVQKCVLSFLWPIGTILAIFPNEQIKIGLGNSNL